MVIPEGKKGVILLAFPDGHSKRKKTSAGSNMESVGNNRERNTNADQGGLVLTRWASEQSPEHFSLITQFFS